MPAFSIRDFGAVGNGRTNDSGAIQKAIDACTQAGGGMVIVPAGATYFSGSFELKARVELHVERGATLLASGEIDDYPHGVFDRGPESDKRVWIRAHEAEDIAITGGGVIDGNCMAFTTETLKHGFGTLKWRPAMTCFVGCKRMRIRDCIFTNAANWTLHFTGCEDIVVHGVSILNHRLFPNCDGIDPDHCRNVRISDCHIEAGDDCIVIKNTESYKDYGPSENITVTGCTLMSTSCAIKIGSESHNDFRDFVFDSCVIKDSNRALGIQLRDGGNMEHILFSNMIIQTRRFAGDWWGRAEPIYITALPRNRDTKVGQVRHVRFINLMCRGENGVYIHGFSPDRINDVRLEQVRMAISPVADPDANAGEYDPRPCPPDVLPVDGEAVGETTPWGVPCRRPTVGVFVQNASNVRLRGVETAWGASPMPETYTHAIEAHGAPGLRVTDFEGVAARPNVEPIVNTTES